MSIQSEINRISGNVSDALDAIEDKGVTIPSGANSDDLADLISQIESGGGVGGITQDQDGYLVLDDEAPSPTPTPSGGLEYETGTWTPASDTADAWISFSGTHTTAPCMYEISDVTGTYDATTYTNYRVSYTNLEQLFGAGLYQTTTQTNFGYAHCVRRSTNTTGLTTSTALITSPISQTADTQATYPRYWAKETGIRANGNSTDYYWRAGKTYKWIAVWVPTT